MIDLGRGIPARIAGVTKSMFSASYIIPQNRGHDIAMLFVGRFGLAGVGSHCDDAYDQRTADLVAHPVTPW